MSTHSRHSTCLFALLLVAIPQLTSTLTADEFRIESVVYYGEDPAPASRNVTLFHDGVVYDFLADPPQITVFRKTSADEPGRLIVLDPERSVRTEISTKDMQSYSSSLQTWAENHKDPLLKFSAQPEFKENFDEREGVLTLASERIQYRLLTEPCAGEHARQYKEFSDWYARAGAMLHPGSMLPFPRLMVNTALARHQIIPKEVHLTVPAYARHDEVSARSVHETLWRLSRKDLADIDRAQQYLAEFDKVDLATFLGVVVQASAEE